MHERCAKIKARRPEYCRFFPSDWRRKALSLSLEAEGLLIRIAAFNMDAGVPLPSDRAATCRMIGVHHHKFAKLLPELIAIGDVVSDETGIYCPRALNEFSTSSTRQLPKSYPTSYPHDYPDVTPELPRRYPGATTPVEAEKTEEILRAKKEKRREEKIETECAREGETHAGHGVFVNCETIRHSAFAISLPGIEMGALGAAKSKDEIKSFCLGHALQWAAEIEGGKRPGAVVPDKIANFLSRSLMGAVGQKASQEVRAERAGTAKTPQLSFAEERINRAKAFQAKLKCEASQ